MEPLFTVGRQLHINALGLVGYPMGGGICGGNTLLCIARYSSENIALARRRGSSRARNSHAVARGLTLDGNTYSFHGGHQLGGCHLSRRIRGNHRGRRLVHRRTPL